MAASLLFGTLSHYPIHRLERLKPLLAHNQHPADSVSVEHSSNTASAGKESCGYFSPIGGRLEDIFVYVCVFTVTPKKFSLIPPRLRLRAPCRRCTSACEHPSRELLWIDV